MRPTYPGFIHLKKQITKLITLTASVCCLSATCKKNASDASSTGGSSSSTHALIQSPGWETVRSIAYSNPNSVTGGFDLQDLVIKNDSVGVLYGETDDLFGGLAYGCRAEYKALFSLHDNRPPSMKNMFLTNTKNLSAIDRNFKNYTENLYFTGESFNSRVYVTSANPGANYQEFTQFGEADEDGNVTIPPYKTLYNYCYQKQNIARAADGSELFARSNPEMPQRFAPMYINYYDKSAKQWLSEEMPYSNGMNVIRTDLPGNPPVITGCWGFATANKTFRCMLADDNGGITIVRPNNSNRHCDTLAQLKEPALQHAAAKFISGISTGNNFIGLLYSAVTKKLYEYKWTEGSHVITKVFGNVQLDDLLTPVFPGGNWKYFEMKPDGSAYQLVHASATNGGYVLREVSAAGVREIANIKSSEDKGLFITMPRYYNGYYYAAAYTWPGYITTTTQVLQLDIIRVKE